MDDLQRLAEAATPGPWEQWVDIIRAPKEDDRLVCESAYGADGDYIAAASPDRILALLRRLDAAEAVCEAARTMSGWDYRGSAVEPDTDAVLTALDEWQAAK